MLAKRKNEIRYAVKGDVVIRHVSFGSSERTSSIKMASWMDRTQDAGALYDQAWLTARREPELRSSNGEIRTVDLFCGCGGLSLGVVEAARALGYRLKSVFASDINKNALDLYVRNFNPTIADNLPIENHVDGELDAPLTDRERQCPLHDFRTCPHRSPQTPRQAQQGTLGGRRSRRVA